MIKGITIHIGTDELKEHLLKKVQYHQDKAVFYKNQVGALEGSKEDLSSGSNNPVDSLANSAKKHIGKSEYYQFIVDHLVPGETYELSENDLTRLEIISYYY